MEKRNAKKSPSRDGKLGRRELREMRECLARLEVWRIENLMAPNGMDRFADDSRTRRILTDAAEKGRKDRRRQHTISRELGQHSHYSG